MRLRIWARRAAGVGGGLLLGLALAEAGSRLLSPYPAEDLFYSGQHRPPDGMYRHSATVGKEPTPGFEGTVEALSFEVRVRFNSLGLRGGEPSDRPKWLAIGDSFTLGAQVPEADTFAARLGDRLGVEVLNAGVDDYSTTQETLRYVELSGKVDVDTVLAVFYIGNDYGDNERILGTLGRRAVGNWEDPPAPSIGSRLRTFAYAQSMLLAYAHVAWNHRLALEDGDGAGARFRRDVEVYTYLGRPLLDRQLPPTERALEQLRDAARERGDRLLVAVAPPAFLVEPEMLARLLTEFELPTVGSEAPRIVALELLERLGVASCDLTPALIQSQARGERPYLRFDGHWNRTGHAVVADAIAACLGQDAP